MPDSATPVATVREAPALERWLEARGHLYRPLSRTSLSRLVLNLGHEPALWRDRVRHDESGRVAVLLHRSPDLDVWLLCWLEFQDTGFHDHDRSAGAMYVCQGSLAEDALVADGAGGLRAERQEHAPASTFAFDSGYIHCVQHAGTQPATSLHVYSPALTHLGHYEPGEGGLLRRIVRPNDHGLQSP